MSAVVLSLWLDDEERCKIPREHCIRRLMWKYSSFCWCTLATQPLKGRSRLIYIVQYWYLRYFWLFWSTIQAPFENKRLFTKFLNIEVLALTYIWIRFLIIKCSIINWGSDTHIPMIIFSKCVVKTRSCFSKPGAELLKWKNFHSWYGFRGNFGLQLGCICTESFMTCAGG